MEYIYKRKDALNALQRQLGHSNLTTTAIYVNHLGADDVIVIGRERGDLAKSLNVTRVTLYRYLNGDGSLKESGQRLLTKSLGYQPRQAQGCARRQDAGDYRDRRGAGSGSLCPSMY